MKIKSEYLFTLLLCLSGFQFTSIAQLNTIEINILSKGADVIIIGKVSEQNSKWNEDKTRIYTDVIIEVEEYLKGNVNQQTIVVTHPGGEVGDVGELYTHMPSFEGDEEILIFLKRDQRTSNYKVFNGEEGKLSIVYDKQTGEKVTTSNVRINSLKAKIKDLVKEQ